MRNAAMVFVAIGVCAGVADGEMVFAKRTNRYSFNYSSNTFFDATATVRVDLDVTSSLAGESRPFNFGILATTSNPHVETSGDLMLTDLVYGATNVTGNIVSTAIGQGIWSYSGDATPNGTNLIVGDNGFLRTLQWTSVASGLVDTGYSYDYYWTMPGDYSAIGAVTGGHELLNLHPSFAVVQDFVYDSITDSTTFLAQSDNYADAPGLSFRIYGDAIPVPTSLAVAGAGAWIFAGRRR